MMTSLGQAGSNIVIWQPRACNAIEAWPIMYWATHQAEELLQTGVDDAVRWWGHWTLVRHVTGANCTMLCSKGKLHAHSTMIKQHTMCDADHLVFSMGTKHACREQCFGSFQTVGTGLLAIVQAAAIYRWASSSCAGSSAQIAMCPVCCYSYLAAGWMGRNV